MASEKTSVVNILGGNIKKLRKERNLTQEELAEKIGLTVKYISHLERALSFPSADTIDKIASAFDVPAYRLFFTEKAEAIPRDVLKKELHKIIDELD